MGEVLKGKALRRRGARPGDLICVSGTIGDGALGLQVRLGKLAPAGQGDADALIRRYRLPSPRLDLGHRLVGLATAAIDVSDGLAADLGHITDCSEVGARVEAEKIPLSPAVRRLLDGDPSLFAMAVSGGDDYELLFTLKPGDLAKARKKVKRTGVPIHVIGEITRQGGLCVVDGEGREIPLKSKGYQHFQR
jgi:thiamine-monophosphate kinase